MIRAIGLKYGLYWGGLLTGYGLIYRFAGISPDSPLKWLFYLFLAASCLLAQRAFIRAVYEAHFGYRYAVGALTAVIAGGGYGLYVFLYNRFVDDSLIQTVVEGGRRAIEQSGAGPEQAAANLAFLEWLSSPAAFAAMIYAQMLVVGLLTALVGALVFRRHPGQPGA